MRTRRPGPGRVVSRRPTCGRTSLPIVFLGTLVSRPHRTAAVLPFHFRASVLDAAATEGYGAAMRSVGLRTLNDNPSEYVWLAAAGETVLVTDHDRVVAEIVPPRVERNPVPDAPGLAAAAREGWLTPPTAPGSGPPPAPPPIMSLDQLLRELGEDRRDR